MRTDVIEQTVSMDTPLVLWSLASNARSLPEYIAHKGFVINVLSRDQIRLSKLLSSQKRDLFAPLDWTPGLYGLPFLSGCAATLECTTML